MVFYLDREGLFEEVTFENLWMGRSPSDVRRRAPSRRDSKCKSPEAGKYFLCSRDSMKAIVNGAM